MIKLLAFADGAMCVGLLINGYLTGKMSFYGSLTFFGEASERQNPVWFWTYTVLNSLNMAGCANLLLR